MAFLVEKCLMWSIMDWYLKSFETPNMIDIDPCRKFTVFLIIMIERVTQSTSVQQKINECLKIQLIFIFLLSNRNRSNHILNHEDMEGLIHRGPNVTLFHPNYCLYIFFLPYIIIFYYHSTSLTTFILSFIISFITT